jgi:hypothetical protein
LAGLLCAGSNTVGTTLLPSRAKTLEPVYAGFGPAPTRFNCIMPMLSPLSLSCSTAQTAKNVGCSVAKRTRRAIHTVVDTLTLQSEAIVTAPQTGPFAPVFESHCPLHRKRESQHGAPRLNCRHATYDARVPSFRCGHACCTGPRYGIWAGLLPQKSPLSSETRTAHL